MHKLRLELKNIRWLFVLAALSLLLLISARQATAAEGVGNAPAAEKRELIFAIHPYLPAPELYTRFLPLAHYLSEQLQRPVTIEISPSYEKHIEKAGLGYADIAFMGPASYVFMTERYTSPKRLLAALEVDGRSTFQGVIIAREGSRIISLTDLFGKRFAFGDRNSTMSHIVPRYMLLKAGIRVEALGGYSFLSNHENVALGVLYGKFDAGAVKQEVFENYRSRGLMEVVRTPLIPEHVFIASHKLPEALVLRIRKALMDLNTIDDAGSVLFPINFDMTGLAPASDHDFDGLRNIIRTMEAIGAFRR